MLSNVTNFPNMITSGGIQMMGGGGLPIMFGSGQSYYYVDSKGSDAKTGKDPDNAFATIEKAITVSRAKVDWTASPWAVRDVIVIAPGTYAENLTALAHGAIFIGLGWDNRDAQMGVKIKPASGYPVTVGGLVNSAFINIGFESADASPAFYSGVTNNCLFLNCRFSGAAESVTCAQAFLANDCTATKWVRCVFTCAAVGFDIAYVDANDKFAHCEMDDCDVHQCTTAGIRFSTNLVLPSSRINRTRIFGGGQTMAIGVDSNSNVMQLTNCHITATDPVEGTVTAEECYGNGSLLSGAGA